jgi:hypothetical protein
MLQHNWELAHNYEFPTHFVSRRKQDGRMSFQHL